MVGFNYDDSASRYLGITLLSLYCIPAVIHIVRTIVKWKPEHKDLPAARSADEEKKLARLRAERGTPVLWTTGFQLYVAVTALAVAALVVLCVFAVGSGASLASYDPFAILGIDSDSTDRQIKSAYRKLSMIHHPDKGGDDATFQKIARAYGTLTNPEQKKNWVEHGNPDGKQTLEVAIGIPSALVGGLGRYVFMFVYLTVLAIAIPSGMHFFWRRQQATKDIGDFGLQINSNRWLADNLREAPDLSAKAVPELLAGMVEAHTPSAHVEYDGAAQVEVQELEVELLGRADKSNPRINPRMLRPRTWQQGVIPPQLITRNNLILHAYINRRVVKSPALRAVQDAILQKCHRALEFMWVVAFTFTMQDQQTKERAIAQGSRAAPQNLKSWVEAMGSIPQASAMLTQAVYGRDSDLLQVFPADLVEPVQTALLKLTRKAKASALMGVVDLLALPGEERVTLLSDLPGVSAPVAKAYGAQLQDLPMLLVNPKYEVLNEEYIAEGDVVTLMVELTHTNVLGKAGGSADSPVPSVLAPRFPTVRPETWVVYVLESSGNMRLVAGMQGAWEPKKAVEKVTMQFIASRAGKMTLSLNVQSLCYVGLDVVVDTTLEIAPRPMPVPVSRAKEDDEELAGITTGLPDKSIEAYFRAEDDESDVSDDESSDDEAEEESGGAGGKRAGSARAKTALKAAAPSPDAGAGARTAVVEAGGAATLVASAAAPRPSTKKQAVEEEYELPSIQVGKKGKGGGGGGGGGQPAARKAGPLLTND